MIQHQGTKDTKGGCGSARHLPISTETDRVATAIVDCAFRVHSKLGPGLLESVYEACLVHELGQRKLAVKRQVSLPATYDGVRLDAGLRLDLVVENCVVIELKAVNTMNPI